MFDALYFLKEGSSPRPCQLIVQNNELIISFRDQEGGMLLWSRSVMPEPRWQDEYLLLQMDQQMVKVRGTAATEVRAALQATPWVTRKNKIRTSHLALITIAGLLITGLAFYVFFGVLPGLVGKAASFVPADLEVQLGDQLAEAFREKQASASTDSSDHYLSKFTSGLDLDTDYPVKVRIIHSEEINAFALPGGNIFIYSGLLNKMGSQEELVALLGHELSHVTKRHSLRSMLSGAATGVLISVFLGDMGGMSSWLMSRADEFRQLDYSRELETEADLAGLEFMMKNHAEPAGMIRLLQLLQKESAEAPALMKYLSTHPDTQDRIVNVKKAITATQGFESDGEREKIFQAIKLSLPR